jgi:predicted O-linked N-acetylglucosamine transferase (SPINDLY family)
MAATTELLELALQYHRAGDLAEAERIYLQLLQADPQDVDALHLYGMSAHQGGKHEVALDYIGRAIAINPAFAPFHNNLGLVYQVLGRFDEAEAGYRQALRLKPDYAVAHGNLATLLIEQGRLTEAVASCEEALRLRPDSADTLSPLGTALRKQGRLAEAVACYRRALELQPDRADTLDSLANALKDDGRLNEAVACFRRALTLEPDKAHTHSNLLFALHYMPGADPQSLLAEHRRWAQKHAEPLTATVRPHRVDRDPERTLRVGYLSPDFREHPVAFAIEPVLTAHDRQRFHIICYSDVKWPDAHTHRLQALADDWRPLRGLSDEEAAERIRQDRIDILVDLAGHTAHNRMLVFARKPAPVQLAYFGYPNTTGLATMDYRITDAHADPPGLTEESYTEELIRLPEIAWCYQPSASPEVGPLPALRAGHITFGSLNYLAKVAPETVALWSRILKAVQDSRLVLLASGARQGYLRVRDDFAAHGIGGERLDFIGRKPRGEYLQLHHAIDIGLDPFPYNGGVTTCDALWMGVPIVTLAGNTYVSRQGISLLSNVGLSGWIAGTPDAYVEIATRWAGDPAGLGRIRAGLRESLRVSSLCDGQRLTRHLEQAYRGMWARWCAAAPADLPHFHSSPSRGME